MQYTVTYGFIDSDVTFTKYLLAEDHHEAATLADTLKDNDWTLIDIEPHE